jgi:hypothetical protein
MNESKLLKTDHRLLLACYRDETEAEKALQTILQEDMTMDRVSILGPASSSGDDPLGVYYPNVGERMVGWGKMGALWGGLWGLITGALGMFLVPGLGPVIAAGPIAEALIGAVGGAGVGAGAMAGAGAVSYIGVAIHRMGVPEDEVDKLHELLESGNYLVTLIVDQSDAAHWREKLEQHQPELFEDYPYVGYT